eukprot:11123907-Lingulodinium_polyedra.AAC.1
MANGTRLATSAIAVKDNSGMLSSHALKMQELPWDSNTCGLAIALKPCIVCMPPVSTSDAFRNTHQKDGSRALALLIASAQDCCFGPETRNPHHPRQMQKQTPPSSRH